ncbi:hypothetical protein NCS57_00929700 [Fusarium keratoplasticum]|uniref:Uncharacterized protein n=1 Tax=Fusarium keratoplasticum TaxID=1328300 RepID=A0ACC0QR10_9HYPO|nr:hypothetical protein NCS57_00929700 [Fusarium keratoplasticum]KAI8663291.1 hypothetical protein NCS57_00929700 [Fusarium keratoplasticum]
MKFINILALSLPAVSAFPQALPPAGKGIQIRDEDRLRQLEESHAQTLQLLNTGVIEARGGDLSKRQAAVAAKAVRGLAGLFLVPLSKMENKIISGIADKTLDALGDDGQDIIWHNHGRCRTYFDTQGGGNCETRTYDRGSKDRTATHKDDNCSWIDPPNNDPPVVYYEGDQGIGTYSIQYTATKEHAWGGIPGTKTCEVQGLCNPQYVFYRDGYNIVLNTWESQGEISYCQYSAGENCRGLCSSGVKDQFASGGMRWGGDCAIPCADEAGLPDF